jgi:hypothetical protein
MGFDRIQTYILDSEPGTSLKASGWEYEATTSGGNWNHSTKYAGKRREDQPMTPKQRWGKTLRHEKAETAETTEAEKPLEMMQL